MHNFQSSLLKGSAGELLALKLFPGLTKLDGRHGDLVLPEGQKVELKTDYYKHKPGGNFFIERYSDSSLLSPGGPWQAKTHACDYFCYFFINSGVGYVFLVDNLLTQLEPYLGKLKPVEIANKSWVTSGYKVPRDLLKAEFVFATDGEFVALQDGDVGLFKKFCGVL